MWFHTTKVYLTAGVATGGYALSAFDNALRNAYIADFNLIKVTSIVPPNVPVKDLKYEGVIKGDGHLLPTIYDTIMSDEIGTRISVAVGVGIKENEAGIIFTYFSKKETEQQVRKAIREMVKETMTAKGLTDYKCKITSASTIVEKIWTCVFAAAVFCDEDLEHYFVYKKVKN